MLEECYEIGICRGIEDDKAGIDRYSATAGFDCNRVRVPAEASGLLEKRNIMTAAQKPRCREARYAGTDHGNPESR